MRKGGGGDRIADDNELIMMEIWEDGNRPLFCCLISICWHRGVVLFASLYILMDGL